MDQLPPNWCRLDDAAAPSWVDEFFDFSTAKRSEHRRNATDSVAFFEASDELDGGLGDDELIMSMFAAEDASMDAPAPKSNPSTDSNSNSSNDEMLLMSDLFPMKCEAEEAQSACRPGAVDLKRVKRILANRQSAQRSRVRKLQYISELERNVTCLQTEVSALSPRVAFLDHQRSVLTMGNSALKQRIAALAQDKIFKDAHQEALRKEIERLRQVYHQQSLNAMDITAQLDACADIIHT